MTEIASPHRDSSASTIQKTDRDMQRHLQQKARQPLDIRLEILAIALP